MANIKKTILNFHNKLVKDKTHRYKSWEYCFIDFQDAYIRFKKNKNSISDEEKDLLALKLGFYLASWGMYRGSSFLLWKDYKIHKPIINKLFNSSLWENSLKLDILIEKYFNNEKEKENFISDYYDSLKKLYCKIEKYYNRVKYIKPKFRKPKNANPTKTLITKILLGTICCCPAYDDNVIAGLRKKGFIGIFGESSFKNIMDFYFRNRKTFYKIKIKIKNTDFYYPPMKLIDMYFWEIGRIANKNKYEN
jgi:hypothetical protein